MNEFEEARRKIIERSQVFKRSAENNRLVQQINADYELALEEDKIRERNLCITRRDERAVFVPEAQEKATEILKEINNIVLEGKGQLSGWAEDEVQFEKWHSEGGDNKTFDYTPSRNWTTIHLLKRSYTSLKLSTSRWKIPGNNLVTLSIPIYKWDWEDKSRKWVYQDQNWDIENEVSGFILNFNIYSSDRSIISEIPITKDGEIKLQSRLLDYISSFFLFD